MRLHMWMCASALTLTPALIGQARLTLAEAVAEALAGNPQVATAAARLAVTEGVRHQAGLSPNPRLFLQSENARLNGSAPFSYPRDADSYAYLAQTIETGGKRQRRVEFATETVHRAGQEQQLLRQQIASRVSLAYWMAAGSARSRDLLRRESISFERVVQFHRDRVREGAAPEVDLLRVEVEHDRLTAAVRGAELDAERASIVLFREMGKIEFQSVELSDALESPLPISPLTIEEILDRRVEMGSARAAVEQAHANFHLQQANAKVDIDAQLGYKRTAGFNTLYASVQIPLPIRNKNQGHIEAAIAEIRAAQSTLATTEALVRSEVEGAKKDYGFRQRLLDETLRPMRERASELFRIAEAAYREGGSDILRLLDAERTKIETQLAYTRTLYEFQQSAVALSSAQGNLR